MFIYLFFFMCIGSLQKCSLFTKLFGFLWVGVWLERSEVFVFNHGLCCPGENVGSFER